MIRIGFLILFAVLTSAFLLASLSGTARADPVGAWEFYKSRFIQEDGRVIDPGNNQMSHSEGQGFTMYLALAAGDRPLFDKLWAWTRNNLMVQEAQGLAAWAWGKRQDGSWGVLDANNATDGDIFLAWTLHRAWERYGDRAYLDAARSLTAAIREKLVVERGGRIILLPGRVGFLKDGEAAFNPSYFIFPAFKDLARLEDDPFWQKLSAASLTLLDASLGGPFGLPPDWAALADGTVRPWGEKGTFFSYDAIRVPLYLAWDGDRTALERYRPLLDLFRRQGSLPDKIPVAPGKEPSGEAPAGFYAVLARTSLDLGDEATAAALMEKAESLLPGEKDNYYSNALYLLAATRSLP